MAKFESSQSVFSHHHAAPEVSRNRCFPTPRAEWEILFRCYSDPKKCESLAYHLRLSENIGIPGALDTPLNSSSLETANPAGSMGYGWFSTENIRVLKPSGDDSELVYRDENGMTRRWVFDGSSSYTPVLPDNRLKITRNLGSTDARYVVTSTDNFRREFNVSGVFKREVDKNGRFTTYTRETSPNYLKIEDDKGRVTYQHFTGSELQPRIINDDINPNLGRRVLLDYHMDGTEQKQLKSIENLNGDLTVFDYNPDGRISERREELEEHHRSTIYTYDSSNTGRLASIRTSSTLLPSTVTNHSLVTFEHNVPFNYGGVNYITTRSVATDLEDPANPSRVSYVAQDFLSRIVGEFEQAEDPDGNLVYIATLHEYNDPSAPGAASGNPWLCTRTFQVNKGAETIYQYTAGGNVKKVIDNEGNETILAYVEENPSHPAYTLFPDLVTEIRRPAPDRDNAPGTFYAPTKFTYNPTNSNLESVQDARGKFTYFHYNTNGQVERIIDRRGFKTYFEYDARARTSKVYVQKSLNPTPGISEYSLENSSNFRKVEFRYNDFDELIETEDDNGNLVKTEYDELGRPVLVTDANEVSHTLSYLNQVLHQITLPSSSAGEDGSGSPLFHTGRLFKMEYDSAGRNRAVLRQDSAHSPQKRAGFAYDGFSQLRSLVRTKNGAEKEHLSSYDRQGRVVSNTDANNKTSTTAYEPFCVGYANTSARGVRSKVSFDTLCQLTQMEVGTPAADPLEVASASETRTFQYDDLGRLLKTSQSEGATGSVYGTAVYGASTYGATGSSAVEREFQYNELDQLTKVIFEDDKEISYVYDDEGNLTQLTENVSSSTPKVTLFSYYGDGSLYEVTYVRSGGIGNQAFRYIYDTGGRPLELWYPSSTGIKAFFSGPDGPSTEPGWDGNGQLKHLRYMKGTNLIRHFEFKYDAAGNRIEQFDVKGTAPTSATRWVYGYDWLDRLESVKKATGTLPTTLGALRLVSMYSYDAADNRTEFQIPNLNLELTETYKSTFDDADNIRLIERKVGTGAFVPFETFTPPDDDGNMTSRSRGGVTTTYHWDDFNRLKAISTSDNSKKQSHTFDISGFRRKKKDKLDVETTEYAAGLFTEVSKANGGQAITYLKGAGGIVGFERSSDGAMFYFLADALSTVRDVVDSTGLVRASYEFDEYGRRLATSESGVSMQKTFVGGMSVQDEVADTGLMMMGHRFYEPELGRFLNRDPIGFTGGANLFEYAKNTPTNLVDPSGLLVWIGVAVEYLVAAGASALVGEGIRSYMGEETTGEDVAIDFLGGAAFQGVFRGFQALKALRIAPAATAAADDAVRSLIPSVSNKAAKKLLGRATAEGTLTGSANATYRAMSGTSQWFPGMVKQCKELSESIIGVIGKAGKHTGLDHAERGIMEQVLREYGKRSLVGSLDVFIKKGVQNMAGQTVCVVCQRSAAVFWTLQPGVTTRLIMNGGIYVMNSLQRRMALGAAAGTTMNAGR